MEKFTTHTGVAVPLRRSNVDTDQIIPAVYLKRVTRTGFEDALFAAWRGDEDFVLNQDAYKAGSVLNLLRWTSAQSIKETFVPATDYRYPFMDAE